MVATPDDILSLAAAREELRMPDGEEGHDALILGHRDAALRYVEKYTSRNVLDRQLEVWLPFPTSTYDPVDFGFLADARPTGHTLHYYPAGGPSPIDGTAAVGVGEVYYPNYFRLRPVTAWPSDAWPQRDAQWLLAVGMAESDPAIRAATVLLMRALYDGVPMLKPDAAVDRLLAPLAVPR